MPARECAWGATLANAADGSSREAFSGPAAGGAHPSRTNRALAPGMHARGVWLIFQRSEMTCPRSPGCSGGAGFELRSSQSSSQCLASLCHHRITQKRKTNKHRSAKRSRKMMELYNVPDTAVPLEAGLGALTGLSSIHVSRLARPCPRPHGPCPVLL